MAFHCVFLRCFAVCFCGNVACSTAEAAELVMQYRAFLEPLRGDLERFIPGTQHLVAKKMAKYLQNGNWHIIFVPILNPPWLRNIKVDPSIAEGFLFEI